MLRPYQAEAVEASENWIRRSRDPFLVDAATGAGKSHIIAEIARRIHELSGKRILCLAPSAELVKQNRAKYLATGNPCSIFSASAGAKELRHPVVFGTPLTVKNKISRFKQSGDRGYAMVVVDECHGITPTVQDIIAQMREANPNLRVMGLTATPYRLGSGYIFAEWPDGTYNGQDNARDPYFAKCVYQVHAHDLIAEKYLTSPVIGAINAEGYDTSALEVNARGQFDADAVDRAYHGQGRKTAAIVADVVAQSQGRQGVMFFAATVRHAQEIIESLPPHMSALVTGETKKSDRERILARFLAREVKYLVNVSVLTTGFDAPHVDVIAMLRKTESVGLLQQIIGRGLRLNDGKADCLVLDYTTNLDDHCPDGDIFSPKIKAGPIGGGDATVKASCPLCGYENTFTWHKRADGHEIDENGYCVDLMGERVETEHGPMPAHHGRRCQGYVKGARMGEVHQCNYRWTYKNCPNCDAENDIAARYCTECKGEIVDPNEKLIGQFRAKKRDPSQMQTDQVVSMEMQNGVSRSGNPTLRVDYVTPYRSFSVWLMPEATFAGKRQEYDGFMRASRHGTLVPETITYRKLPSGFYKVFDYNRPRDVSPEETQELETANED